MSYCKDLEDEETRVEVIGMFKWQTDSAILIDRFDEDLWIPKSVVLEQESTANYKPFSLLKLEVKEWWAIKNVLC